MVEFPLVSCVRKFLVIEVDQRNHGRARKILGITNKIYILHYNIAQYSLDSCSVFNCQFGF